VRCVRSVRALRAERACVACVACVACGACVRSVRSVRSVRALRVRACVRAKPNLSDVLNRVEFEIEFQFPVPNPFFRNNEGRKP